LRIGSERVRCDGGGGGIGHGGREDDEQKNRDYVYVLTISYYYFSPGLRPSVRASLRPYVCTYNISGHIKKKTVIGYTKSVWTEFPPEKNEKNNRSARMHLA